MIAIECSEFGHVGELRVAESVMSPRADAARNRADLAGCSTGGSVALADG